MAPEQGAWGRVGRSWEFQGSTLKGSTDEKRDHLSGFLITVWNSGISGGRRGLLGTGGGTQGLGGVGGNGEPLGTPREEGGRGMLNLCRCPWAGPDVHGYTGRSWGRICGHTTAQTFRGRRGCRHTSCWMSSRCGRQGCSCGSLCDLGCV